MFQNLYIYIYIDFMEIKWMHAKIFLMERI